MPRALVLSAAVALAAVACSGGDDADVVGTTATMPPDVTEAAPATTDVVTTPTPLPTTEPPPATDPPVETTVEEPAAESTAPPTTERVLTPEELEVVEAARVSATTWYEVFRDPENEDLIQAAAIVRTGPALTRLVDVLAEVRTSGLRSAANPDVPARVEMYEQTVTLLGADRATVEYCYVDADFTVEIGTAVDGGDVVLDDSVLARHGRSDLVLVEGSWLVESGVELSVTEGSETCDV